MIQEKKQFSRKIYYTLLVTLMMISVSVLVSSGAVKSGHDASNIRVDIPNNDGTIEAMSLSDAVKNHRIRPAVPATPSDVKLDDKVLTLGSSSNQDWICVTESIEDHCADEDGCIIRGMLQHETSSVDEVRTLSWQVFMEQDDMSNNNFDDTYLWAQYPGDSRASRLGNGGEYTVLRFWNWMYAYNYNHKYCKGQGSTGPAFDGDNLYDLTFMVHPDVQGRIVIED